MAPGNQLRTESAIAGPSGCWFRYEFGDRVARGMFLLRFGDSEGLGTPWFDPLAIFGRGQSAGDVGGRDEQDCRLKPRMAEVVDLGE
jgi:hypothetical protein